MLSPLVSSPPSRACAVPEQADSGRRPVFPAVAGGGGVPLPTTQWVDGSWSSPPTRGCAVGGELLPPLALVLPAESSPWRCAGRSPWCCRAPVRSPAVVGSSGRRPWSRLSGPRRFAGRRCVADNSTDRDGRPATAATAAAQDHKRLGRRALSARTGWAGSVGRLSPAGSPVPFQRGRAAVHRLAASALPRSVPRPCPTPNTSRTYTAPKPHGSRVRVGRAGPAPCRRPAVGRDSRWYDVGRAGQRPRRGLARPAGPDRRCRQPDPGRGPAVVGSLARSLARPPARPPAAAVGPSCCAAAAAALPPLVLPRVAVGGTAAWRHGRGGRQRRLPAGRAGVGIAAGR